MIDYTVPLLQTMLDKFIMDAPDNSMPYQEYRVMPKLSPFCQDNPGLWFAQAELQFQNSGISRDDMKFSYATAHLQLRWAREVQYIIISPTAKDRYVWLREELIRRLSSLSSLEEKRMRHLLTVADMADRTQSQFLQHL